MRKINKIDNPLARLTRGHRDSIHINKIRNEKREITTETEEIQTKSWAPTQKKKKKKKKKEKKQEIWMKYQKLKQGTNVKLGPDKTSKQSHNL